MASGYGRNRRLKRLEQVSLLFLRDFIYVRTGCKKKEQSYAEIRPEDFPYAQFENFVE